MSQLSRTVVLLGLSIGIACQSTPRAGREAAREPVSAHNSQSPSPSIDKVELAAIPTVLNLDDQPGADGVQVQLRLWRAEQPLAALLERGVVEFVMYDGKVPPAQLHAAKPHQVWSYSAQQLKAFSRRTLTGAAYSLALTWGDRSPQSSTLTLTARILRPDAAPLYAEPLNLAMGAR